MDYSPFLPEPYPPFSRALFWGAMLGALAVIFGFLFVGGRVREHRSLLRACADVYVPSDARVHGIDEEKKTITLTWEDVETVSLMLPYDPAHAFEGCSPSAKNVLARAYRDMHPRDSQAVSFVAKRIPDRDAPQSARCGKVQDGVVVKVVRLRGKLSGNECITVRQSDMLRIENATAFTEVVRIFGAASVSTSTMLFTIRPHASTTIARPVGEYLLPGVHRFAIDPSVAPEIVVLPSK